VVLNFNLVPPKKIARPKAVTLRCACVESCYLILFPASAPQGLCTKAVFQRNCLKYSPKGPRKDILQRVSQKQRVKTDTRRSFSKLLPHIWNLLKPYTKRPPKIMWKHSYWKLYTEKSSPKRFVFTQIVIVIFVFKDMQWKFAGWGNRVFDFCGTICKKSGRRGSREAELTGTPMSSSQPAPDI
jgi:hypothetical protein